MNNSLQVRRIFIGFLIRDHGFEYEDAAAEYDFITAVGVDAYRTASRIGLRPLGNRAARISIIHSYENAQNHASFLIG